MQIVLDPTQKCVAVICGTKRIKQNHWHLEFTNCNGWCHCIWWHSSTPYIHLLGKSSDTRDGQRSTQLWSKSVDLPTVPVAGLNRIFTMKFLNIWLIPSCNLKHEDTSWLLVVMRHTSPLHVYAEQLAIANKLDIVLMHACFLIPAIWYNIWMQECLVLLRCFLQLQWPNAQHPILFSCRMFQWSSLMPLVGHLQGTVL